MRIDYRKIIAYWILLMWSACMLLWLTGCSAQYHLNRYQTKGGVCGKIDTIRVQKFDTITNTYYYHDSLVIVNDRVVPKTRTEIRYEYKTHRDTVKLREVIVKGITRQKEAENKNPWIWVILGGMALTALVLLKFK